MLIEMPMTCAVVAKVGVFVLWVKLVVALQVARPPLLVSSARLWVLGPLLILQDS